MKKQRKVEKDNRGVAIYARKSRITNKGDSIGVPEKITPASSRQPVT